MGRQQSIWASGWTRAFGCLGLVIGGLCSPAMAQYRCVEEGRTVFTDRPCMEAPPAAGARQASPSTLRGAAHPALAPVPPASAEEDAYATPFGTWQGPVHIELSAGKGKPGDVAVVPMTLAIAPQGELSGDSPQLGCKVTGMASPGINKTMLNLEVALSECRSKRLNRRFVGSLVVSAQDRFALLTLNGIYLISDAQSSSQVHGTLRR